MQVISECPHCGARFKVQQERLGHQAKCSRCGETFTLTRTEQAAQQASPYEVGPCSAALGVQTPEPHYPAESVGHPHDYHAPRAGNKTSGLAIASICCGVTGVVTCCIIVPSILGVALGLAALPAIRTGGLRGRGLAIGGIVTGALGFVLGVVVLIVAVTSPEGTPIAGSDLSPGDRQTLETMGVVQPDEEIVLFYTDGMFSIREGGVLITANRLVSYGDDGLVDSFALADIQAVQFHPGASWMDEGQFVVDTDAGETFYFQVAALSHGDHKFYHSLRRQVSEARKAAGKTPLKADAPTSDDE